MRHEVDLNTPDKEGVTYREHLEQLQRATGERERELDPIEIPQGAQHLWVWFWELDVARGSSGLSINPISYVDILSWALLTGANPKPWEVQCLKIMDAERLRIKKRG